MAGVSRDEINVAGISDHFTIGVVTGLEDAGFCKKGEGGAFVEKGGTSLTGRLPTNTSGRVPVLQPRGSCGIFTLIELFDQLRPTQPGARWLTPAWRSSTVSAVRTRRSAQRSSGGSDDHAGDRVRQVPAGGHPAVADAVLGVAEGPGGAGAAVRQLRGVPVIPKDICNHCHSDQLTWTPIRGHGEIYTYTVVRRAPPPPTPPTRLIPWFMSRWTRASG